MFTKMKRGGFFRVHPVCSMLAGALVTIGIGTLLVTKRRALADATQRMADAVSRAAES